MIDACFFYNYRTVGDVLMAVIEPEKIPTRIVREHDIAYIYEKDRLIGINFFEISNVMKIRSEGWIPLPPKAMIEVLNTLIASSGFAFSISERSKYRVGKILGVRPENGAFAVEVDIGEKVLKVKSASFPEVDRFCVVALRGAMRNNGSFFKIEPDFEGWCCTKKDLDAAERNDEILYPDRGEAGQDFFSTKGGN